jgi:hypothetical protein
MRLDRVRVGDVVLCRIKGRAVYGEVLEVADGSVRFRPLCPAAGWHRASAREVAGHWRKAGRHRGQLDVDGAELAPAPREQSVVAGRPPVIGARAVDERWLVGAQQRHDASLVASGASLCAFAVT